MVSTPSSPSVCFVCNASPRASGLLCDACAKAIAGEPGDLRAALCSEQIRGRHDVASEHLSADAALLDASTTAAHTALFVDGFGVAHVVIVERASASIGRARDCDLSISERTVSADHALLEHREKSNAWFLADMQSQNGTFVNGDSVQRRFPLEPGDAVFFGRRVGFYFVPVDVDERPRIGEILRASKRTSPTTETRTDVRFDDGSALKIRAVTEGGAIASWSDERVQLSELEYELLAVLHGRFASESALDDAVRGFVPASHLLEVLSFKSEAPTHANLRGLVRKVRKKLAEGNPSLDVIESKKGLGYRLARPLDLG